jgi:hypothetical protein
MRWASKAAAVCALVALLPLLAPSPCPAAEVLSRGQPAPADGIFFDEATSVRLLREVEEGRICREEVAAQDALLVNLQAELREREEKDREWRRALDAAKQGGSWWEKTKVAGKWIGIGIAVGFVAGASR